MAQIHYETAIPHSTIGNSTWQLPIIGRHQADNVAAALTAIDLLFHSQAAQPLSEMSRSSKPPALAAGELNHAPQPLSEKTRSSQPPALAAGELNYVAQHLSENAQFSAANLQGAFSSLILPARLQPVATSPVQIIDTAHNPASLAATLSALDDHFPNQPRTIVFASSRDKEFTEMLRILIPRCQCLVLTAYQNNPRALALPELRVATDKIVAEYRAAAVDNHSLPQVKFPAIYSADHPTAAWKLALRHSDSQSIVCGTGSFFLAAELLPLFLR